MMNFEKLSAYLDSLENEYGLPGLDCKIMKDHQTVFRHMNGYRDYEKQIKVSPEDLHDVYSCTKIVTMVACMQLVEQGKLGLYHPLKQYFPEFLQMRVADGFHMDGWPVIWPDQSWPCHLARHSIRICDLMSMTSGLTYDLNAEPIQRVLKEAHGRATTQQVVRAIAQMILPFEPREKYLYGLGHDVLGAVVEKISAQRYETYLKEHIFRPLGLNDLYMHLPEKLVDMKAAQYAYDAHTERIVYAVQNNPFCLSANYDSGGAGLTCTVDAYCAILDALCNGGIGANGARILTEESIEEMRRNRLNKEQLREFAVGGRKGYGYGLGVRTLMDGTCAQSPVGEFGWDGAAGAYALIDPQNHVCMFYAQQVLGMSKAYSEIHPTIRDLAYEGLRS